MLAGGPPEGGLGSASDPQSRPPALAHGKGGRLHNLCRLGGHVGEEVAHSILGPERSHGGGGGGWHKASVFEARGGGGGVLGLPEPGFPRGRSSAAESGMCLHCPHCQAAALRRLQPGGCGSSSEESQMACCGGGRCVRSVVYISNGKSKRVSNENSRCAGEAQRLQGSEHKALAMQLLGYVAHRNTPNTPCDC